MEKTRMSELLIVSHTSVDTSWVFYPGKTQLFSAFSFNLH